jgi:hypothetical protein
MHTECPEKGNTASVHACWRTERNLIPPTVEALVIPRKKCKEKVAECAQDYNGKGILF